MLDMRSAGQLVGLLLIARVLAYGLVRLIEARKPRPVHFVVTAAFERNPTKSPPKEAELPEIVVMDAGHRYKRRGVHKRFVQRRWVRTGNSKSLQTFHPKCRELGKMVWKTIQFNLRYYQGYLVQGVLKQRCKAKKGLSLQLITESIGLLTAGLSLAALIIECIFK